MPAPRLLWIFYSSGARLAGGAFEDIAMADYWIAKHKLTGVLMAYPIDEGCFDWELRRTMIGSQSEKLRAKMCDPAFVGGFVSTAQARIEFENGKRAQP